MAQAISWTNVGLLLKVFGGIHLRAISQEVLMNFICNVCYEITLMKLLPHLPLASELTVLDISWCLAQEGLRVIIS